MAKIKIDVLEGGKPSATITVPLWLARGATGLLTKAAGDKFCSQIDVAQVLRAAESPEARGVILEIEDHQGGDKVSISVVAD